MNNISKYLSNLISKFGLLVALITCGCTTIHIHDQDSASVTTKFGITLIRLNPSDNKSAIMVQSSGLGVTSTPRGTTVGFIDEALAIIPEHSRCQVFLWVENSDELESVEKILHNNEKSLNNICVFNKEESQ